MTKRSPSVQQAAAQQLRTNRAAGAWDQASVAELLTAFGLPTKAATVVRIENGAQPATVEQLLLLALVMPGGLRTLLRPPFRVGDLEVADDADLDVLLTGAHLDHNQVPLSTGLDREAGRRSGTLWDDRRHKQIAESLGATPRRVQNAAQRLYGHSAEKEIQQRFTARLEQVEDRPVPESAAWRAHRAHAVRAVTSEIGEELR